MRLFFDLRHFGVSGHIQRMVKHLVVGLAVSWHKQDIGSLEESFLELVVRLDGRLDPPVLACRIFQVDLKLGLSSSSSGG